MIHPLHDEILSLLKSKNRCLERLAEATRAFLRHPLEALVLDDVESKSPLFLYDEERSTIVRTLELHDRRINELIGQMDVSAKTPEFLADVRMELESNERLISGVVNADEIVFARIREAQAQISKLVAENRKSREILSKFKSAGQTVGEEVDRTL